MILKTRSKYVSELFNKSKIKILSDKKALCHNLIVSVFSFLMVHKMLVPLTIETS